MGYWFDDKDSVETVLQHTVGKHTPDSIKQEARRELISRGFSTKQIEEYIERNDD